MHKIGYMTPPRGSQDASRTPQDGFCLRSGRQLGAILGIFFRPRRPPGPQDASKRPSWECLGASWGRVGASWRPRANKSVSWSRLGLIFIYFWEVFCLIFGRFLIDFLWILVDSFHFFFNSFGFLSIKPSAVAGSPLCGALDIYIYIYKCIHTHTHRKQQLLGGICLVRNLLVSPWVWEYFPPFDVAKYFT